MTLERFGKIFQGSFRLSRIPREEGIGIALVVFLFYSHLNSFGGVSV